MSVCSDLSKTSTSSSASTPTQDTNPSTATCTHLHWKRFRKEVLTSHHIRVLETVPTSQLPDAVSSWIEANHNNTFRFKTQREHFRKQVAHGRGFGDSALFPYEVLPWTVGQPFIAKCMVPRYSAEPLPERITPDGTGERSLTPPRPGFACGFSSSAFGPEELKSIPDFLATSGTTLQFDTGSITPDSVLYCPFMTFERTFGQQRHSIEIAANQCAVDGAWCIRSLEMLRAKANRDSPILPFEDLVSFTCAIDNTVAIINYHWVDHAHTYCMAPVVKFQLSRDDHFNQFLVWIEAIGQWSVSYILPEVKNAISLITENSSADRALMKPVGTLQRPSQQEHSLFSALKLSYENIPWRLDGDDASAVSSSTASWGSPMINEAVFSKLKYPIPLSPPTPVSFADLSLASTPFLLPSTCYDPATTKAIYALENPVNKQGGLRVKPTVDTSTTPWFKSNTLDFSADHSQNTAMPMIETNTDLVTKKRLNHAMDEIRDLQNQLVNVKQEFSGSTMCLQNELLGLRKSMTSFLRKERLSFKQGSSMRSPVFQEPSQQPSYEQHLPNLAKEASTITTPTDPTARPNWRQASYATMPKRPSGLQNMLTLDTTVSTSVTTTTIRSACDVVSIDSQMPVEASKSPSGSSIMTRSPTTIGVCTTNTIIDGDSSEEPHEAFIQVSQRRPINWSPVLASHVLCTLVPSAMLRVIVLGLVVDYCMVTLGAQYGTSVSQYVSSVVGGGMFV